MALSRRELMIWAASASGVALMPGWETSATQFSTQGGSQGFEPKLLPTADEVWGWQLWMNKLGPKYTGNDAHRQFVEFLAKKFEAIPLDVGRDTYKFPRWEARGWNLKVNEDGTTLDVPVSYYYPYSGQTPKEGVTGELVYGGTAKPWDDTGTLKFVSNGKLSLPDNINGKIVLLDFSIPPAPYDKWYKVWGFYNENAKFPTEISGVWGIATPLLTDFKKAGAAGVVLAWTNISDDAAAYQYTPFSRPLQDLPALWVGHKSGSKLRKLAGTGAKVTLTLDAEVFQDAPTDTLIATLPGKSADEVIIVNTHTDGPNATEENGALGVVALAKYFAALPQASRNRTLVFVCATGHFALPYVPSIEGVMKKHPDLIKKAVASVTIEHLVCQEWLDNGAGEYKPTGKDELSLAITDFESTSKVMLESLQGGGDRRVAVVKGLYFGEGGALSRAGVPNIGYIPIPSYLVAGPSDGCIEKLSRTLMYSEIEVFAKAIHKIDTMSAAELKATPG